MMVFSDWRLPSMEQLLIVVIVEVDVITVRLMVPVHIEEA